MLWHEKLHIVERFDPKSFSYSPSVRPMLEEDGDLEVLRDRLQMEVFASVGTIECPQPIESIEEDTVDNRV
jgi:hypothetical protein